MILNKVLMFIFFFVTQFTSQQPKEHILKFYLDDYFFDENKMELNADVVECKDANVMT